MGATWQWVCCNCWVCEVIAYDIDPSPVGYGWNPEPIAGNPEHGTLVLTGTFNFVDGSGCEGEANDPQGGYATCRIMWTTPKNIAYSISGYHHKYQQEDSILTRKRLIGESYVVEKQLVIDSPGTYEDIDRCELIAIGDSDNESLVSGGTFLFDMRGQQSSPVSMGYEYIAEHSVVYTITISEP